MASTTGRRVVVPLTNKSGGGVIAGDVVIVDTSNDDAFTTTTSAAFTGTVGIAQATIANNAVGPVLLNGEAALVNVSASVTRGHFGATHTVVKQAASAGASRTVGTFVQFKTGGTTPKGFVFNADLGSASGSMATDALWDAAGDLAQGTGANTGAKLSAGTSGMVLTSAGAAAANAWAYPPGFEFDYVEATAPVTVSATVPTFASATALVTGNSVTYPNVPVLLEFAAPSFKPGATAGDWLYVVLYDGSTEIGHVAFTRTPASANSEKPCYGTRRYTPSAGAHTFAARGYKSGGNGSVDAGAGGAGQSSPMFLRVTKV